MCATVRPASRVRAFAFTRSSACSPTTIRWRTYWANIRHCPARTSWLASIMPRRSPKSRSPQTTRLLDRHDSGRGILIAKLSDHPIEGIGFGRIAVVRRGKFAHWELQSRNTDLRIGQLTRIDDLRHNPSVPEFGAFSNSSAHD